MKKIQGALCLALCAQLTFGQVANGLGEFAGNVQYANGSPCYASLRADRPVAAGEAASFISTQVLGGGRASVTQVSTERDDLGFTHTRYQVYMNGYPVASRIIIAHIANGRVVSINGDLQPLAEATNAFAISESAALNAALAEVNASHYKWENKEEEAAMAKIFNDPGFSYAPKGTKTIYVDNGVAKNAFVFNIYADQPLYRANVFVDASNGRVLHEEPLICNADVPGTATTKYSGIQPFTIDQNGSTYRLRETQRGLGIETYNCNYSTSYLQNDFTNSSTSWTTTGANQGATDAHWGAEMTYDYYWNQHGRNSINNAGFKLVSFVHYSNNYTNAFWDGQRMSYGDGNGGSMKIFTTLDICGHEISHGLTANTAGLAYSNESGALNESYSDIFGTCIENYGRPTNWNWKIGEDMTAGGYGLRNMSNPGQFGDPSTYGVGTWYTGTNDNGGVHTNSGVSNYWFYLLTAGGSGVNGLSNSYAVTGIGINKSARIAYRALTVYYTPSTNFAVARNLSIQAAIDLYGNCSQEMISTINAWYAVGVGNAYTPGVIGAGFIANNTNYCMLPAYVTFSNTTASGLTYSWDLGDGTVSTLTNVAHTYTAPGNYNVKLIASGCSGGVDSVVKSSYITIGSVSNPVASDVSACMNSSAVLTAAGTASISWYDSQLSSSALATGSTFTTPALSTNTVFYVSNGVYSAPVFGGMTSITGGGVLNSTAPYLIFNVNETCVLNSVVVYAYGAGNRTFQLRNSVNGILSTTTVSLTTGANTVTLNYNLNPGVNYRLGLSSTSGTSLYRTTSGVSYPYSIGSMIDIVSSSLGSSTYCWYYNWQVTKATCASGKMPVNVNVLPLPQVTATAPGTFVCVDDEVPMDGFPAGGLFSGSAVNNTYFSASSLGAGTYTVNYSFTDSNGCTNSSDIYFEADICEGISGASSDRLNVYPNPAHDQLTVSGTWKRIVIRDAAGRVVSEQLSSASGRNISTSQLAPGIYMLEADDTIRTKFVKQ